MAIELFVSPLVKKKPMSTASRKAKGRKLQDLVRDTFKKLAPEFGVEPEDIKSCLMGDSGLDIKMSKAAEKVFAIDIECKNKEKLAIVSTFFHHFEKYEKRPTLKVLIHKIAYKEPLITLKFTDFMEVYTKALRGSALPGKANGEHDVA